MWPSASLLQLSAEGLEIRCITFIALSIATKHTGYVLDLMSYIRRMFSDDFPFDNLGFRICKTNRTILCW